MINGFALETEVRARQAQAMDWMARERLAAEASAADPRADGDRSPVAAKGAVPAARRLVPRLVGFVPALRPRATESL